MDDDVETLGWARGRWSLHHPVPGVSDWTVVVWPSATVRRAEDATVIEADVLATALSRAAAWLRAHP